MQELFILLHSESAFGIRKNNTTGITRWEIKKRKVIENEGKTWNKMNYYDYEYSNSNSVILKKRKRKTSFHWAFSLCKNKISEVNIISFMYFNKELTSFIKIAAKEKNNSTLKFMLLR